MWLQDPGSPSGKGEGGRLLAHRGLTSTSAGRRSPGRRPAEQPLCLPPSRPRGSQGTALGLSSQARALGAWGRVRVGWTLPPGCGPFCLRQVERAGRPVSCEQGREESELGRPGDGWKLLLGGPPFQQEQGKCQRGMAGAPWPQVCGVGAVGVLSAAPPTHCTAQALPQAGSKALWATWHSLATRSLCCPVSSPGHWAPSNPFLGRLEGLPYQPRAFHLFPVEMGWSAIPLRGRLQGGPDVTCSTEHCPLRLPGRCCSRPESISHGHSHPPLAFRPRPALDPYFPEALELGNFLPNSGNTWTSRKDLRAHLVWPLRHLRKPRPPPGWEAGWGEPGCQARGGHLPGP